MTKKIIFICGNLYPFNLGGAEVYNYYLMQSMADTAKVLCINPYSNSAIGSVNHHQIKSLGLKVLWFPFFTALKLIGLRNKSNTHLVLTFSRSRWIYWVYYPILRKLFGLHYTVIIHGGGLSKWRFKFPFVWFFKNADYVVAISERIKQEYEKRSGVEIKLLPPLIPFNLSDLSKDEARNRLGVSQSAKVILQVGSLKKLKHPETAIEALRYLEQSYLKEKQILLMFAGDGPDRTKLEQMVIKDGLTNYVKFLGNVSREQINHVYKQADLYLIASDFEGTPLSMLEAMENRLPVIASNAPGINNIIIDKVNGRLFPIGNGKELAAIIRSVLSNPEPTQNWTLNAKKTIKRKYNHNVMLEELKLMWGL